METLVIILLISSILALLSFIVVTFFYIKSIILYKKELETPEDEDNLYDFINIKDNIINLNHIINIKRIQSTKEENYKLLIELDDNKEPIIFDYDDDWEYCNNVFEELKIALNAAIIVTD